MKKPIYTGRGMKILTAKKGRVTIKKWKTGGYVVNIKGKPTIWQKNKRLAKIEANKVRKAKRT